MPSEPLRIIEVMADEVSMPPNDGTRGSGLYRVPIRLNRAPDSDEANLLVELWNDPPQYTSSHRKGIARVEGDRIVLDGTTIDEVERYHAKTLTVVVTRCNADVQVIRRQRQDDVDRKQSAEDAFREHVAEVAKRIRFEQ